MARVTPRFAAATLLTTLVVSIGAGYAWSRVNGGEVDDTALDNDVSVDQPGDYAEPGTIATAPRLAGTPLPDATISDLAGNQVSATTLAGKPMVINVWASTCLPCEKELPDFAAVHGEIGDTVRFVGLNYFDTARKAEEFATDRGVRYELYLDDAQEFISELEIAVFPTTLFVAADGTIVELHIGALNAAELRSAITEELGA